MSPPILIFDWLPNSGLLETRSALLQWFRSFCAGTIAVTQHHHKMFAKTPLIVILSNLSTLLPVLACVTAFKILKIPKNLILLWWFFAIALTTEISVHIYHILGRPNAWIVHVYTFFEYAFIVYILSTWQNKRSALTVMRLSIPAYFAIYVILKASGLENFEADSINHFSTSMAFLLISGFVFYTFHQLAVKTLAPLYKDFRFWILMALAIYYSGSLIIFAFMYIETYEIRVYLGHTHAALNILQNILFTVGVICAAHASPASVRPKPDFIYY